MSKKISLGVAATIAIIAMAVTFSLTMVVSMKMFNTTVSSVKNKERQYNKLSEIDRFVRSEEFFTIDEDTLNDRLAAGYMNGINDKYAVYYTAKEYSEKQAVEKGTLTGIGVAVVNDASSGYARIIRLYDNSPAAEAGMQVGGFITAINDESTRNITSSARLTSKLLGEEGTTTAVTYLTPDRQEQQFNLVHSNYKTPSIYAAQMVAERPTLPPHSRRATYVAPLNKTVREPEVVVFTGTPEQMMWLCMSMSYYTGHRFDFHASGYNSMCVEAVLIPMRDNEPNITFGCYGCRAASDVGEDMMFMGIPTDKLPTVTKGLTELAKKAIPHSRMKIYVPPIM